MLFGLDRLPLAVIAGLALVVVLAVWRYVGGRAAGMVGAAAALLAIFAMGRKAERQDRDLEEANGSLSSIRRAEEARRRARRDNSSSEALKHDDGFKRVDPPVAPAPLSRIDPPLSPPALANGHDPLRANDGFKRQN